MSAYKVTGRQTLSPAACQISAELAAVQKLMPISSDDRATLRESIKRDGIREPLRGYYSPDGDFQILSGLNRLEIARELGLPVVPVEVVEVAQAEREAFAIDENRARRQLTLDDKRQLAAWLLKRNPGMSNNQAGKLSGLDDKTAGKVRQGLERRSEIPNVEKRTDSKGRMQAARKNIDSTRKASPERTGNAQKGAREQGRGDAALKAFNSALNDALKTVEMQPASVLKVAVRHAKSWLKDVERKHRAAERVK